MARAISSDVSKVLEQADEYASAKISEGIAQKKVEPKSDERFEAIWKAYGRKGAKNTAFCYWQAMTLEEKALAERHVTLYVSSREMQFRKDFERYLKSKCYLSSVYDERGELLFDPVETLPTAGEGDDYQ